MAAHTEPTPSTKILSETKHARIVLNTLLVPMLVFLLLCQFVRFVVIPLATAALNAAASQLTAINNRLTSAVSHYPELAKHPIILQQKPGTSP
jgi:hypothetical protein